MVFAGCLCPSFAVSFAVRVPMACVCRNLRGGLELRDGGGEAGGEGDEDEGEDEDIVPSVESLLL